MEKAFISVLIAPAFALTMIGTTNGQTIKSNANPDVQPLFEKTIPASKQPAQNPDSGFTFRNEISIHAVRTFLMDHKTATNARWFKATDGLFGVYFTADSIVNTIFYNKNGDTELMILDYDEDKLPSEIRDLVKVNFTSFSINHVNEFRRKFNTAYVIVLENKNSWKKIKVVDGDVEIVNEFSKIKVDAGKD